MKINCVNFKNNHPTKAIKSSNTLAEPSKTSFVQQNTFHSNYLCNLANCKANIHFTNSFSKNTKAEIIENDTFSDVEDLKTLENLHNKLIELNKKEIPKKDFTTTSQTPSKELFHKIIKSIALTLDAEDQYTRGHSMRVALYSILLARAINIPQAQIEKIEIVSLLHDIGKIAIPDSILSKPGKLTNEEFEIIKTHPIHSERLITGIKKLEDTIPTIKHHHERWDGKGYPDGLHYEKIPYYARIIALADTYDAMTSDRPYRKGLEHNSAIEEIKRCSNSQFDPILAQKFIEIEDIIEAAKEDPDKYYSKYSSLYKEIK